jgi:hypothetical protein
LIRKKALGQSVQQREELVNAIDHQSTRHTSKDLIIDEPVRMGVIPEQAWTLPAERWNAHLVLECFAGLNVNEYVIAVA